MLDALIMIELEMVEVGLEPTKTKVDSFTDCSRYQFAYSTKIRKDAYIELSLLRSAALSILCFKCGMMRNYTALRSTNQPKKVQLIVSTLSSSIFFH